MKKFLLLLVALVSCCSLWADDKVDTSIPVTTEVKDKTFVLVISNENYKHEESVPFANNDGEVFAVYCEKTLGVPAKNIHRVPDATLNDMNHELEWLTQVVKAFDGQAHPMLSSTIVVTVCPMRPARRPICCLPMPIAATLRAD